MRMEEISTHEEPYNFYGSSDVIFKSLVYMGRADELTSPCRRFHYVGAPENLNTRTGYPPGSKDYTPYVSAPRNLNIRTGYPPGSKVYTPYVSVPRNLNIRTSYPLGSKMVTSLL